MSPALRGPQRRVYMLAPELLDRVRHRQIEGGHANETETVRYLLTDALARWEERQFVRSLKAQRAPVPEQTHG